jgi:ElaB/YqjD/DUF883 family membrane-anchored ribosome-binding protein
MATPKATNAKPGPKPKATTATMATPKPAVKPTARVTAAKPASAKASAQGGTIRDQANAFASTAKDKARTAAESGKAKATEALDGLSQMADDVAKTIDERLGSNYGDYARKAASTVAGIASSLQSKDVEELIDDTRKFVRSRPAVAIGAAAAVGFLLTRLVKAGSDDEA